MEKAEKNALRQSVRREIDALPEDYIKQSDAEIFVNIASLREFIDAQKIFMYYSVGREPDTIKIAEAALNMGKTVAFPFCYKGGIMEARVIKSLDDLKPAMLGIPAPPDGSPVLDPHELDFIIVPALAYDKAGFRLGYGGGYYDRFLENIPALKVGIARERLVRETLPREAHDIAADILITESRGPL